MFTIDIGGEGRHSDAWNINPCRVKTFGPDKGKPIPRWMAGRASATALPDHCVDRIIMERTPLRREAVVEILRVTSVGGEIVLRHFHGSGPHPHDEARMLIQGQVKTGQVRIGTQFFQETVFHEVQCDPCAVRSITCTTPQFSLHGVLSGRQELMKS